MLTPPRASSRVARSRGLRGLIKDLSPLQLGIGYFLLHLAGGGLAYLVIAPGVAKTEVIFMPWIALVSLIAFFRDDDALEAAVLLGVMAAVSVLLTLLLRAAVTEFTQAEMSALLFGYFALPILIGLAAGVNAGIVIAVVRLFQRTAKRQRDAEPPSA